MNKILACFLLIAVLASSQCSIWDSVKGWVQKGVNIVTTKAAEYASKWANDFVAKYPMFKDIYKQLINSKNLIYSFYKLDSILLST